MKCEVLTSHDELSLSAPLRWSLCVLLMRSASIIICHLHKIDKCHARWQWYKYLVLPRCFTLTNLQRPPLDLLTVPGLMGNDDTDGLTANLPSGHLEQLSWWLIEKETHHWPCIDFFFFYREPSPFLRLPVVGSFSIVLTLNFDLTESGAGGHCQCPSRPSKPPAYTAFSWQIYIYILFKPTYLMDIMNYNKTS